MKLFFCFCLFCLSLSALAQSDTTKLDFSLNKDSILNVKRDATLSSRRDSVVNSIGKELGVSKSKMEAVLTAFAQAAGSINQIASNDELTYDEKSTQVNAVAEQRDTTLKSLLNGTQLEKVKNYIIRRKIPRKK
jgi:hypothetical protein